MTKRRFIRLPFCGLVAALALVGTVGWMTQSDTALQRAIDGQKIGRTPQTTARSTDSFVETIGVNTHLYYNDTNYAKFDDVIKPKLLASGIRYVRDGVHVWPSVTKDHWYYQRLRSLKGIRFDLVTNPRNDLEKVKQLQDWLGGSLDTLEGINEPDAGNKPGWVEKTRSWQKTLYDLVHQTPGLAGVKVIGPSPINKRDELGDLSAYMDYANTHSYAGGKYPSQKIGSKSLDFNLMRARIVGGTNKTMMMTETGYHNALQTSDGHKPASEKATGKYIPRLLFENFNRQIARTFTYEFMETRTSDGVDIQKSFGMLRGDGTEKPVYTSVKNLIAILSDRGPDFTPDRLDYSLLDTTPTVHSCLLEKRDHTFYLALWQEVSSWDIDNRRDLDVPEKRIRLKLAKPAKGIEIYRPSVSDKPLANKPSGSEFDIDVPDEVLIVRIL